MAKNTFPAGLYVAATPLGHLADISDRVRDALTQCDVIFAEDTRRAQTLLSALGIGRSKSSIRSLHEYNEEAIQGEVLRALEARQSVLLISDAGTPAVSDPGALAVDAAWNHGYPISPLPGPSAVIAALSVCGFKRWPISFWGFAPAKSSARKTWLEKIRNSGGIVVIFETPHRADESLHDCATVFGSHTPMLFAREMTKQHETLLRSSIEQVTKKIMHQREQDPGSAKGEMVWVFDLGDKKIESADVQQLRQFATVLASEMPASSAAKCLVKMLGVTRDAAYEAVLSASTAGSADQHNKYSDK